MTTGNSIFSWFEKRIDPFPRQEIAVPPRALLKFIWGTSQGMRKYLLLMGLLAAVVGAFEAVLFVVLGKIVDWLPDLEPALLWSREGAALLVFAAVILGSVALVAVQTWIRWQTIAGNYSMRMRWQFHRLMLNQSMSFFQDEFAGRIAAKVMQTAQALRDMYMIVVDILVFAAIYFLTMTASVGYFDRWLLLPFGVWLVLYLLALRRIVPRLAKASTEVADARSLVVGRITDAYTNIATVKLFSHAGREASYAKSAMGEFLTAVNGLFRRVSWFEIANHSLSMFLILASGGVTLLLWSQGQVGVGALAAVGAMALRLNGMSHWIMWESTQLFEHIGTVHDGLGMLSRERATEDAPGAGELAVGLGDVKFDNITFSYAGEHPKPVLENFSLNIRPGEKIGLVGRSGAGKSTLVSLLLRFHDIDSGRILIDGQDIARVTQDSLRAHIGMVMQDTSLLHRSVRDNILYGRPEAGEEEMRAAARRAEADEFIARLMDAKGRGGYDAHVGERGVKLSGGQRQRIAIARVMLKDAPILLLDEATSALDSEVETAIQENLYRLMEGKTVLAIAHRLSTVAAMDRLVVIDQGRIVEEGSHLELLKTGRIYAKLWAHQSGGFLCVDQEISG
ncbi:MAG: ABC transporter ATP-binding protein/permease [Deltaproteobacteria bacterium]|jgi:ATP-binding cassette subfamily B multidrug efflux pump|nr:ABC transporter ATP-binding protein/permease [Deltaproteobacteria bacterium]